MEAVDRILSLDDVYRHPLDACLFMVFDPLQKSQLLPPEEDPEATSPGRLVATFGIHLYDLLGCADISNETCQKVKQQLHDLAIFNIL